MGCYPYLMRYPLFKHETRDCQGRLGEAGTPENILRTQLNCNLPIN